jgi:hypothetical protein
MIFFKLNIISDNFIDLKRLNILYLVINKPHQLTLDRRGLMHSLLCKKCKQNAQTISIDIFVQCLIRHNAKPGPEH